MKKILIIVCIIAFIVIWFGYQYNKFISLNNKLEAQWAQVDNQLQRRFDSIQQAVDGLKISNKSEQDALQKITEARKIYMAASGDVEAQVAAANNFGGAMNGLLLARAALGENYPNLKTPDLVGGLISGVNIEGNENRLAVERMRYNEIVKEYNDIVMKFPSNLIASIFGFSKKTYFELTNEEAKKSPSIAPNLGF